MVPKPVGAVSSFKCNHKLDVYKRQEKHRTAVREKMNKKQAKLKVEPAKVKACLLYTSRCV